MIGLCSVPCSFGATDASPLAVEIAPTPHASTRVVRRLIRRLGRSLGMPDNIRQASKGHVRTLSTCSIPTMVCTVPKTRTNVLGGFCLGTCYDGECPQDAVSPGVPPAKVENTNIGHCRYVYTGNGWTCKQHPNKSCIHDPTPCNLLRANTNGEAWGNAHNQGYTDGKGYNTSEIGHCGEAFKNMHGQSPYPTFGGHKGKYTPKTKKELNPDNMAKILNK